MTHLETARIKEKSIFFVERNLAEKEQKNSLVYLVGL